MLSCRLGVAAHGGADCRGNRACAVCVRAAARPAGSAGGSGHMDDRRSSGTRGEGEGEGTPAIRWACGPPGFDGNPFR